MFGVVWSTLRRSHSLRPTILANDTQIRYIFWGQTLGPSDAPFIWLSMSIQDAIYPVYHPHLVLVSSQVPSPREPHHPPWLLQSCLPVADVPLLLPHTPYHLVSTQQLNLLEEYIRQGYLPDENLQWLLIALRGASWATRCQILSHLLTLGSYLCLSSDCSHCSFGSRLVFFTFMSVLGTLPPTVTRTIFSFDYDAFPQVFFCGWLPLILPSFLQEIFSV